MSKKKPKPESVVKLAVEESSQVALSKAQSKASMWQRRHRDAVRENAELHTQVATLAGVNTTPARQKIRTSKGRSSRVAIVAPATDWHVEEVVTLDGTNGKNEYNLEIAEDRIKRYYGNLVEMIDQQASLQKVDELWHPLLGDFITGYIHEELEETNELSPTEAINFVQEMICSGIDHLRKETKLPIFIPTCVGNHGRTTGKSRIKTVTRNSFEWLLYMTMQKYYSRDPKVQWFVGNGYHNTREIKGRKFRFHHGDWTRYNGGVGGITIPVNKSIKAWDDLEAVDFDVFGHFHQHLWHYPKWISCGCLIGYSDFALMIKAVFQHPSQPFIVVDRDYGLTQVAPIFVTVPFSKRN